MTIVCERLGRRFGERQAVAELSFEAHPGEVLGLLGPNGAGKTTTMRMLTTALTPSSGTARICGHDVRRDPLRARAQLGYLPETVPLPGQSRVCELFALHGSLRGLGRRETQRRAGELLLAVGLEGIQRRLIRTLSKGQRQRVGLALALLVDPPVLILDEPTEGLDPAQARTVRELLRDRGNACTLLFSTHILSEIEAVAARVLVLRAGRCVALATREELASTLGVRPVVVLTIAGLGRPAVERLLATEDVLGLDALGAGWMARLDSPSDRAPELARQVIAAGADLLELRIEQPTLEDLFLRLTGAGRRP